MAGAGILVDGKGVTVTHAGSGSAVAIANIISVEMPLLGEAAEINMTGADNTAVETSLLSTVRKIDDITIKVKANPAVIAGLSLANGALVITLPTATATVCTFQAQLKSASKIKAESKQRGEVDLVYHVTNLNSSNVETAPSIV